MKTNIGILVSILEKISVLPYAEKIVVFGSMAALSDNPGDLDIAVLCDESPYLDDRQGNEFRELIRLAYKNYGLLDPFICFEKHLLVRSDDARSWIVARNARAIKRDIIRDGKPISEILNQYKLKLCSKSKHDLSVNEGLEP